MIKNVPHGGADRTLTVEEINQEFGRFCPLSRRSIFRSGVQDLCDAGIATKDIAGTFCISPRTLDAIADGQVQLALAIVLANLKASSAKLRFVEVSDERLELLRTFGFSDIELAWAFQTIRDLSDLVTQTSLEQVAKMLHAYFVRGGCALHSLFVVAHQER